MADTKPGPDDWHEPSAAVRMSRNGWPVEAIHNTILMPCTEVRRQLAKASYAAEGYAANRIVNTTYSAT